jgi:hypothetical protein
MRGGHAADEDEGDDGWLVLLPPAPGSLGGIESSSEAPPSPPPCWAERWGAWSCAPVGSIKSASEYFRAYIDSIASSKSSSCRYTRKDTTKTQHTAVSHQDDEPISSHHTAAPAARPHHPPLPPLLRAAVTATSTNLAAAPWEYLPTQFTRPTISYHACPACLPPAYVHACVPMVETFRSAQ